MSGGSMFKETLKGVVEGVEGGRAALLMGFDGLMVDKYSVDGFDIETLGAEFSVVLNDARKAALSLDAGETNEISFRTEQLTTVIRFLDDEYFVALSMTPGGNMGKGRFLLRLAAPRLIREL
jgi:predicted regulator of Ras-like GTPase activity (Roadblock/LC7/MglB family)